MAIAAQRDVPPDSQSSAPRSAPRKAAPTLESLHPDLAEALLREQLSPTPANASEIGDTYWNLGVLDAALDHYEAAVKLNARDARAHEGIARIWREWGYAGIGLGSAYRAVYWAPRSASAQNTLGTLLQQAGAFDAANERFELARTLDPGAVYPVNNLCYLRLRQGRADDAVTLCRAAASLDPQSSTVRNNLAMALAAAGDIASAMVILDREPLPAVAAYNQGVLFLATQQIDRARLAFTRARIADPSFAPALWRLKALARRVGR